MAGTKGKGSTSAFVASILSQYSSDAKFAKIGLYTSPHLRSVRERIQINNEPIPEDLFTRYFFEVWDRLEASVSAQTLPPDSKPMYFRFLTLLALHTYLSEGVQTAVIECGIGGEYDATNIIQSPTVCAVTSLGIDHTAMLGNTVEEIAWHKAGIFKRTTVSRQAFTVDTQPPTALAVLQSRAVEKDIALQVVSRHPDIDSGAVPLGLAADFQKTNASLAVAVAAAQLRLLGVADIPEPSTTMTLPAQFRAGLAQVKWGGRCEVKRQGNIAWHIDGGHTLESIKLAAEWFATCIGSAEHASARRILLFNQQTRDAPTLARALHMALDKAMRDASIDVGGARAHPDATVRDGRAAPLFDHAIFSTNVTYDAGAGYKADLVSMNTSAADVAALSVQRGLAETWSELEGARQLDEAETLHVERRGESACTSEVQETIEAAIARIQKLAGGEECVVLVTGSLHLVGGVLEVLDTKSTASS